MSAFCASYPPLSVTMTSGAIQYGVPMKVFATAFPVRSLPAAMVACRECAAPKSASFATPVSCDMSTLSPLRSRCAVGGIVVSWCGVSEKRQKLVCPNDVYI